MKLDDKLKQYYQQFDDNHQQLRDELLSKLPEDVHYGRLSFISGPLRFAAKAITSIAAVLLVAAGLSMISSNDLNFNNDQPLTAKVQQNLAWADITEMINRPTSLHCKMTTFVGNTSSSVLFWWQQPNDHRMEFTNGMINAASQGKYYTFSPDRKQPYGIKEIGFDAPNPGQFILDAVGVNSIFPGWFDNPNKKLIEQSQIIENQEIVFNGRKCFQIMAQKDNGKVEYIIDRFDPIIYKATQYSLRRGKDVKVAEVEILEINKPYPESLFKLP